MEGEFFVLLASARVDIITTGDELLEHAAVLFGNGIDEIAGRTGDVHVPGTGAVPVEEIDGVIELSLRRCECGFQIAAEVGHWQPPVPFAACVQMKGKSSIAELLPLIDHEALRIGLCEHLGEELVTAGLGTQGTLQLSGVEELVFGTGLTIDRHTQEVNTGGFGDDGINDGPEAESGFTIAILRTGMQEVLKFGEVGIADFGALIVEVRVIYFIHCGFSFMFYGSTFPRQKFCPRRKASHSEDGMMSHAVRVHARK